MNSNTFVYLVCYALFIVFVCIVLMRDRRRP